MCKNLLAKRDVTLFTDADIHALRDRVVTNVVVSGNSVKFTAVELEMAEVDLTASAGSLKGTILTGEGSIPIEFKRTGEARVKLVPPSPAVPKELEGDWEGSLHTPSAALAIVFHFRNQPDKTVAATMDSPAGNATAIPLNAVKQSGQTVEFGIRVAHPAFGEF